MISYYLINFVKSYKYFSQIYINYNIFIFCKYFVFIAKNHEYVYLA